MIQKNTKNQFLNPCPYCGGSAKGCIKSVESFKTIHNYYVMCTECGASTEKYNTEFSVLQDGRFHVLTRKEAVARAITDWNNRKFDIHTRLSYMSDKEKIIWYLEKLLSMAWYGAMVPVDSPEYIAGWQLREMAENMELLKLHNGIDHDLNEVARILFDDFHAKDIIYQYLQNKSDIEVKYCLQMDDVGMSDVIITIAK